MSLKNGILLGVKFLFSGALIWYFLNETDLGATAAQFQNLDPLATGSAIALIMVQILIVSVRWTHLLRAIAINLPYRPILRVIVIANFFNATLISSVGGDAVRLWLLTRFGIHFGKAVNGILLDRIAGLFGLLALMALGLPMLMEIMANNPARWGFPLLLIAALVGLGALLAANKLPSALSHWRVMRGLATLAADSRTIVFAPRNLLPIGGQSILVHLLAITAIYVLARGLDIEIGFLTCFVLIPPVILAMTLPISIAGWGVREGAMIAALGLVGVSQEQALVLSVVYGLCLTIVGLMGGVVWLFSRNRAIPNVSDKGS